MLHIPEYSLSGKGSEEQQVIKRKSNLNVWVVMFLVTGFVVMGSSSLKAMNLESDKILKDSPLSVKLDLAYLKDQNKIIANLTFFNKSIHTVWLYRPLIAENSILEEVFWVQPNPYTRNLKYNGRHLEKFDNKPENFIQLKPFRKIRTTSTLSTVFDFSSMEYDSLDIIYSAEMPVVDKKFNVVEEVDKKSYSKMKKRCYYNFNSNMVENFKLK